MSEERGRNTTRRTVVDSEDENDSNRVPENALVAMPTPSTAPEASEIPKATSRGSKKEKKKKEKSPEEIEKHCYETIREMRETYDSDLKLNAESKPGHCKIDKVDELCARIIKKGEQEVFVKMGILKELRRWLEPLPDDSLPNQKIKRGVLGLLGHLRVRKGDLLDSGIGKIVNFYSRNAKEAPEIRKMSGEVVKKWKAMIIREDNDL